MRLLLLPFRVFFRFVVSLPRLVGSLKCAFGFHMPPEGYRPPHIFVCRRYPCVELCGEVTWPPRAKAKKP